MAEATLRERLHRGERLVGTFVKLPALESVDLAKQAGCELVVVDLEHSQLSERQAGALARHAAALGLPALVRLPAVEPGMVNRLLESGAVGVQVSTVRSSATVEDLRQASRYPPDGVRSVSASHPAADYGRDGLPAYLDRQEREPPLIVGQIETATTDDALETIVRDVDVAFVGLTDLSVDLGFPGDFQHAAVTARVDEIARTVHESHAHLGGWAPDVGVAADLFRRGVQYVLVGSDVQFLSVQMTSVVAQIWDLVQ